MLCTMCVPSHIQKQIWQCSFYRGRVAKRGSDSCSNLAITDNTVRGRTILISSDFNLEFDGEEMVTCLTTLSISSSKQIRLQQLRAIDEDNADNEYIDIGF